MTAVETTPGALPATVATTGPVRAADAASAAPETGWPGSRAAGETGGPDTNGPAGGPGAPGSAGSPWRRLRWLAPALAVAVAVGGGVAGVGYGVDALLRDAPATPALGPGEVTVQMDVEHSLFTPEELRVLEGTRVRFVVVNGDPIGHELVVGPPDVHARHAEGMEAEHPSIPGEVSVGAGGTAVTTFTFDTAGTFEFACHLPGHYEHGMHGTVEVVRGVP